MSLTPVHHAAQAILDHARTLSSELVTLPHANGRVLASSITADREYPPYDRVMMDGICFSSSSPSRSFTLVGTVQAGAPQTQPLEPTQAWRINTGGALPSDCDVVVPVEELEIQGETATIVTDFQPTPYQFVHRQGSDMGAGHPILPAGSQLNAANLSIAASVGSLSLSVTRAPRIFILTTGQEAVDPASTPTQFQIRRSHPTALHTALCSLGISDITFEHLPDDFDTMKATLHHALSHADVILTCGAISKGSSDFLGQIFGELAGEPQFHGVSQRPGKPLAYWSGAKDRPAIFALPGNAISTLVTFHRYVAPYLESIMGRPLLPRPQVTITHDLSDFHLTRFLPVELISPSEARLHAPQNSGDFGALAGSDGFVEIPLGTAPASPTTLDFYPWL